MAKFKPASTEQAFFKAALYGSAGTGKSLTALLWAEQLAKREGKRIAYIDTEHGVDFYAKAIPERTCHPQAFDFDRLVTRSISETIDALVELDTKTYGVIVIDSITHLWEAAKNSYNGKLLGNGQIPIQAWGSIKKPNRKLMTLFLDGNFHAILCGREGIIMEENDEGEIKVVGHRMKAEGETPYEPHVLGRMTPQREKDGTYTIQVFFEKDRSGILTGKTYKWPTYDVIAPVISYLSGETQGQLGSAEDAADKDIAAREREEEQVRADRLALYNQIRQAIIGAHSLGGLDAARSLMKGKKTKLADKWDDLVAEGTKRMSELTHMETA